MAVSSIKDCWYRISARIRDYLDVVDSYYRPAYDEGHTNGNAQAARGFSQTGHKDDRARRGRHVCDRSILNSKPATKKDKHSANSHNNCPLHPQHFHHHHTLIGQQQAAANNKHQISATSPLPPGISRRKTSQGQIYFVDTNGHKYWYDPSVPKELLAASISLNLDSLVGPLSSAWEIKHTSTGKVYYVNHTRKTTQFTDPRLIVYKDQLMSILKHIKSTTSNSQPSASTDTASGLNHSDSHAVNQSQSLSTSGNQVESLSPRHMDTPIRNQPGQLVMTSQTQRDAVGQLNNSRQLTKRLSNDHTPAENSTSNQVECSANHKMRCQYQSGTLDHPGSRQFNQLGRNLMSGSHHNLSSTAIATSSRQTNTLTSPTSRNYERSLRPVSGSRTRTTDRSSPSNRQRGSRYERDNSNFRFSTNRPSATGSVNNLSSLNPNAMLAHPSVFLPATARAIHESSEENPQYANQNHYMNLCQQQDDNSKRNKKDLFDKISILRQELLKQQVIAYPCRIDISRKRIFEESFRVVSQMQPRDLKKRLLVKFKGEEGLDYGGVAREWFYLLSREVLNPVYGLFQYTSDDNYSLQINPDSGIVYREHLSYMNFCGRIIGMAVFHGHFIEGHLSLPFYKMLLRKSINLCDIEFVDPDLHRSLCWILNNDITNVIDTTFTVQHNAFGQLQEHELKEGGKDIVVTEENKHEYVSLYVNYRCRRGIEQQFEALKQGFYELISPALVENFDEHELELLIGGLSQIDIEDWRLHTKLKNCNVDSPLIKWFWDIVASYGEDKRARLLQFVTGSPRVPIQGFKALQGVNSELRLFTIHLIKNACTDNLPKSHTCFNRIDLPPYESFEKLRDKLTQAIEETMGFAMQ